MILGYEVMANLYDVKNIDFNYLVLEKIFKNINRSNKNRPIQLRDEDKFIKKLFYLDLIKNAEFLERYINYIKTDDKSQINEFNE